MAKDKDTITPSKSAPTSGLAETTEKAKKAKPYSPLEQAIARTEGVKFRGLGATGPDGGKFISRDAVDQMIKASPFTAILKRMNVLEATTAKQSTVAAVQKTVTIIDLKVTNILKYLGSIEGNIKKMHEEQMLKAAEDETKERGAPIRGVEKQEKEKKGGGFLEQLLKTMGLVLLPLALKLISKFKETVTWVAAGFSAIMGHWRQLKVALSEGVQGVIKGIKNAFSSLMERLGFGKKVGAAAEEAGAATKGAGKVGEAAKGVGRAGESAGAVAETTKAAKVTKSVAKGIGKISAKGAKMLGYLVPFRGVLSKIPLLAKVLMFIDPLIAAIKVAASGGSDESWKELKHSFAKAMGAFMGGELGVVLGGAIGSIVPGFGTIIGAVAGAFAGAAAGEYLGEKLAEIIFDDKPVTQVVKEIGQDAVKKVKDVVSSLTGGVKKMFGMGGEDKKGAAAEAKPAPSAAQPKPAAPKPAAKPAAAATGAAAEAKPAQAIAGDEDIKKMIKEHEGVRYTPYKDSLGLWTVGVGHLIGDGKSPGPYAGRTLSENEVNTLFEGDYAAHKKAAMRVPGFDKGNKNQQAALIDLTYNMGPSWHKKFPATAKSLGAGDFTGAAENLKNSLWYRQVGRRGATIVAMLASGAAAITASREQPKDRITEGESSGTAASVTTSAAAPKTVASPSKTAAGKSDTLASLRHGAGAATPPKMPKMNQGPNQQYGIPSPMAPYSQEDFIAAYFNANEPPLGVPAMGGHSV